MKRIARERLEAAWAACPWPFIMLSNPEADFILCDALCAECLRRFAAPETA